MEQLIPQEVIEKRIFMIRGQKVIIDRDLAELYGVETRHLKRQVRRNIQRFPEEFMFQLTKQEILMLNTLLLHTQKLLGQKIIDLLKNLGAISYFLGLSQEILAYCKKE